MAYPVGTQPSSLAVVDLNGDGKLDLVVADSGSGMSNDTGDVAVLLGKGDGTFRSASYVPAGPSPLQLAAGDLNGDGKPDLVIIGGIDFRLSVLIYFRWAILRESADGLPSIDAGRDVHTVSGPPAYSINATPAPAPLLRGDVNADGKVSVADATLALRFAIGLAMPTDAQRKAAEVSGDSHVSVADATIILRLAIGL